MKLRFIFLLFFFALEGRFAQANELSKHDESSQGLFNKVTPQFLYSYIDFDFDSTTADSFNRFQGHSNLYSIGADHLGLSPSIKTGLYLFKIDSEVNSQFLLAPKAASNASQIIHNNTLLGHVRKSLSPQFDVDLSLGYGQNKVVSQTIFFPNSTKPLEGYSRYHTISWIGAFNGFYKKAWDKWVLKANLGLLYSQINAGSYFLNLSSAQLAQMIAPLKNKATYVFEGAELAYQLRPKLFPFLNCGLIQVADFSNSRSLITPLINGSLPQLNMDKNGVRVGGGMTYIHKQFSLRVEQKYYNAGNTYTSNQTIIGLEYRFS